MKKPAKVRNTTIPCSDRACKKQDCPNFIYYSKKNSYHFPDCIYHMDKKNGEKGHGV